MAKVILLKLEMRMQKRSRRSTAGEFNIISPRTSYPDGHAVCMCVCVFVRVCVCVKAGVSSRSLLAPGCVSAPASAALCLQWPAASAPFVFAWHFTPKMAIIWTLGLVDMHGQAPEDQVCWMSKQHSLWRESQFNFTHSFSPVILFSWQQVSRVWEMLQPAAIDDMSVFCICVTTCFWWRSNILLTPSNGLFWWGVIQQKQKNNKRPELASGSSGAWLSGHSSDAKVADPWSPAHSGFLSQEKQSCENLTEKVLNTVHRSQAGNVGQRFGYIMTRHEWIQANVCKSV